MEGVVLVFVVIPAAVWLALVVWTLWQLCRAPVDEGHE